MNKEFFKIKKEKHTCDGPTVIISREFKNLGATYLFGGINGFALGLICLKLKKNQLNGKTLKLKIVINVTFDDCVKTDFCRNSFFSTSVSLILRFSILLFSSFTQI